MVFIQICSHCCQRFNEQATVCILLQLLRWLEMAEEVVKVVSMKSVTRTIYKVPFMCVCSPSPAHRWSVLHCLSLQVACSYSVVPDTWAFFLTAKISTDNKICEQALSKTFIHLICTLLSTIKAQNVLTYYILNLFFIFKDYFLGILCLYLTVERDREMWSGQPGVKLGSGAQSRYAHVL